jgi:uncharacterized membrane protein YdfJ with MMPL/SSD domain
MQDVDAAIQGGHPGIELIDVIFAYSNVKLVRELVQDQIKQLEEMDGVSKGQAEGLKGMIMAKQKALHANLSEVEKLLEDLIDVNSTREARMAGMRNIQMNAEQSQALVSAVVFAINHMAKFIPGSNTGGSGLPESMV